MKFLFPLLSVLLAAPSALLAAPTSSSPSILLHPRQAPPNTVYTRYPETETASLNLTFFVLPAPRALAQQIAGDKYPLMASFRERLPADVSATIGEDEHPLFVLAYFSAEVHYASAPIVIPALSVVQTYAAFVDCTGDGKTACFRQHAGYFDQLPPAILGNVISSIRLFAGSFDPPHSPYRPIAGTEKYGFNVSDLAVGLLGGGKPYTSSFSFASEGGGLTGEMVQQYLAGPLVRSLDTKCLKSDYFFNETTTPIRNIVGDVDVRSPLLPLKGLAGQKLQLKNVLGLAAAVQRSATTVAVECSTYANGA
ncbi:hypothetical protein A4X09_0g4869 [Tilletia walkeri]|uniref:Uncharacterized protein n=1 Tax=Tilletia walkeri TaxID=117179 RepID=A0A8X7N6V2_9BASI|nr:hypothetical protein A4X09_0g4869 [Tilletia walkeri]